MGNFPSAVSPLVTLSPTLDATHDLKAEDWATAQRLTERISQASSSLADQPVALLKYLSNIRKWTLEQTEKPSDVSFEVSNVGVFSTKLRAPSDGQGAGESGWKVTDMVFSQSASGLGVPFNVNIASAEHGPLTLVVSWWPGMLGVDDEERFVEDVYAGIEDQLENVQ